MSNKEKESIQLLQGTLDLIVLRTLATMGPQHAYQIATRLQQISARLLNLNQGTLYPALIRLLEDGWDQGSVGRGCCLRSLNHEPSEAYFSAVLSAFQQLQGGSRTGERNCSAPDVAGR